MAYAMYLRKSRADEELGYENALHEPKRIQDDEKAPVSRKDTSAEGRL